jgi:dUTP pyrophosphatase
MQAVESGVSQQVMDQLKKLHDDVYKIECEVLGDGTLPRKAHASDAGFDLFATSDIELKPGQIVKHPLNIKLALPTGTYAEITTKSGLGSKGQLVYAGIIDQAYRGIPHVLMTNLSQETIIIKKHQKCAQLILHPFAPNYFIEQVEEVDTNTDRSTGGFGSSGAF